MIHQRRRIKAGRYSVVGTRKATHWARIHRHKGAWPLSSGWKVYVLALDTKGTETMKLLGKWKTFRTLKEATAWALDCLSDLHKDIKPHLYVDLTRPAGAPLD